MAGPSAGRLERSEFTIRAFARSARFAAAIVVITITLITWIGGWNSIAAEASQTAAAPAPAGKLGPPALIGPCRVTLAGGRSLEGIAVFREATRIRLVLEDGTEIDFDPAKVVSVVSLADVDDQPAAPPVKEVRSPAVMTTKKDQTAKKRTGSSTSSATGKRQPAVASGAAAKGQATKTAGTGSGSVSVAAKGSKGGTTGTADQDPRAAGKRITANGSEAASTAAANGNKPARIGSANQVVAAGASPTDSAAPDQTAAAGRPKDHDVEVAELAGMLESAINNADLEGPDGGRGNGVLPGAGRDNDGTGADAAAAGDGATGKTGPPNTGAHARGSRYGGAGFDAAKSATGRAPAPATPPGNPEDLGDDEIGQVPAAPSDESSDESGQYHATPEELDATNPVRVSGFRFLGPKGELPSTPPQNPDFPKPATPSVTFVPPIWRPTEGFGAPAKWPDQLAPGTSFSNALSGWGNSTTSFGPSWWVPQSAPWTSPSLNQYWTPTDGFAKKEKQKADAFPK